MNKRSLDFEHLPLLHFLLFLFLVTSGCATESDYKKDVLSWIGKSNRELVTVWGYPDKQITAPDGDTVYIYHKSRTLVFSQTYANYSDYYNSQGTYTNTQIEKLACTTWFDINPKTSLIKQVVFKGNLCMAGGLGSDHPPKLPSKN